MKNILRILALLVGVIALPAYSETRKEIIAGPVEVTGNSISGSFRVEEARHGGIVSDGTGGACLIFSKQRSGGATCESDGDCTADPGFADATGICVRESSNAARGKCWTHPADTPDAPYCHRSPFAPNPMNQDVALPVDDSGNPHPLVNPTQGWWRVFACLNGAPQACGHGDLPHLMFNSGPARKIP